MGLKHKEEGVTGKRIFSLYPIDDLLAQGSSTEEQRARGVGYTTRHSPSDQIPQIEADISMPSR